MFKITIYAVCRYKYEISHGTYYCFGNVGIVGLVRHVWLMSQNYLIDNSVEYFVLDPTNIAALLINGETLHK
jgi:hypothetical protein